MVGKRTVVAACLVVRILQFTLLVKTFFNPDEYWQSLEVAHRLVFGCVGYKRGWHTHQHAPSSAMASSLGNGRRASAPTCTPSCLQPSIRCVCTPDHACTTTHQTLRTLRLDTPTLVVLAPKLLQACVAAYTDYHVWQLAMQLFGRQVAAATLGCQLTSWFNAYCLTRTFSSSCEAGLIVHALRHYLRILRKPDPQDLWRWAVLAALSAVVRPPAALFWTVAGVAAAMWRL